MIDSLRRAWNRTRALFRGAPLDAELDAEIGSHIEAAIEDNLRLGMAPQEARRQALVRFGSVALAREQHREARSLSSLDILRQDLRFTLRKLRRERAFAGVVILVLALGIGANVAVFGVVNTILLHPLPFQRPNGLVWFATNGGKGGLSDQTYTVSAFEEFARHNQSFQDVTSYQTFFNSVQYKLNGRGDPLPVVAVEVAENFFPMLGVQPSLGRQFTPAECRKGGAAVALLSHGFWQRQFGGNPAIVGRTVTIDALPAYITAPSLSLVSFRRPSISDRFSRPGCKWMSSCRRTWISGAHGEIRLRYSAASNPASRWRRRRRNPIFSSPGSKLPMRIGLTITNPLSSPCRIG